LSEWHKESIRATLGDEYYQGLQNLLEEEKDFLNQTGTIFVAGDINPSNIIRRENGQLCFIDWERGGLMNAPAHDYGFMFVDLWNIPVLQERYFRKAVEVNQDIPDFKEHLRLDFIFFRGVGELTYWWKAERGARTSEEKEKARKAIDRYTTMVKEAVEQKGIWAEGSETNQVTEE